MDSLQTTLSVFGAMFAIYAVWNGRKSKVDFAEQYSKMLSEATKQIESWMEQVERRDEMLEELRLNNTREIARRDELIATLRGDLALRDTLIRELRNWAERLTEQVKENNIKPVEFERRND